MAVPGADPTALKIGPGYLYMAPLGSDEPDDLATAWDAAWVPLGYTEEGHEFSINPSFDEIPVAEELTPLDYLETARELSVSFQIVQITAANMQAALNGGDITTAAGLITYEPPNPGEYTPRMLGWQKEDASERIVWRRCIQVGSVGLARRKAPTKTTINCDFRVTVPADGGKPFTWIMTDPDYVAP
jgi:hypothetical protein